MSATRNKCIVTSSDALDPNSFLLSGVEMDQSPCVLASLNRRLVCAFLFWGFRIAYIAVYRCFFLLPSPTKSSSVSDKTLPLSSASISQKQDPAVGDLYPRLLLSWRDCCLSSYLHNQLFQGLVKVLAASCRSHLL